MLAQECHSRNLPSSILIREVGPREGFQILPRIYPTADKLRLIGALVDAGLSAIEVTSFVRSDRVPQMADADSLVAQLIPGKGVRYSALYLNRKGFERGEAAPNIQNDAWLATATSDSFLKANSNTSRQGVLDTLPDWLSIFASFGKPLHGILISTAFGCHFEGDVSSGHLARVARECVERCRAHNVEPKEICLADTVGRANPEKIRAGVRQVGEIGVPVSLHLHDTWGLGLANVMAGLEEGVSIFETSIGGMGGCPFTPGAAGNVATEEVVYLCESLGISTGVDLEKCCRAVVLAEQIVGQSLPGKVHRALLGTQR